MNDTTPAVLTNTPGSKRSPSPVPRRGLLFGALSSAFAAATVAARAEPPEIAADVDPSSLLNRLIARTSFGFTDAERTRAAQLGYAGYLEYQLNFAAINDSAVESSLSALTTLTMAPLDLYNVQPATISNQLTEATIRRAAFSNRQLFQRMVEFWTDHLNIDITTDQSRYIKTVDDRVVIRGNALGTFRAILTASAHSPAMLNYLDNDASTRISPNENYARELLELHTMGSDGGYTQQDVEQVARCFTGWTRGSGATHGQFRFNPSTHDTAQKIIFDNTPYRRVIPARSASNGELDGMDVLDSLVRHPSTAAFIAKKLTRWFIGEDAPQSLIDSVAAAYGTGDGDIKAMVRRALSPNAVASASPKLKRPFHAFVGPLRSLPTVVNSTSTLRSLLDAAGHRPFYWGPPDGYPDTITYWSGFLLPRWNFGASLLFVSNGGNPGISGIMVDVSTFLDGLDTVDAMLTQISDALFGGEMPPAEKARIGNYLAVSFGSQIRQREAIGLAIGSPSFQWY